jgi:(1->4)-alpha-D-glucan 1-alpha-D-glucosylmutase
VSLPRRLGATYRLQLTPETDLFSAARLVPYLARLGIETVYCSPVAEAVPGSAHGYDGTDPTRLRAELGGEAGYDALVAACERAGLGVCVDHVPNHLATWHHGPWWRRLLAEGRDSEMGQVFDVDWDAGPEGARGKVTLPLLDRPLEEALKAGAVGIGERAGEVVLTLGEVDLPVAGGWARQDDDIVEVLAAQHYRLVDWHDQRDRNYRRFFDIDGLVGVRVEDPEVFETTHALVLTLARSGRLSSIRIDHIDGLAAPTAYLRRLADAAGVPIVVEKILTGDERLRSDWPVAGTTGYEVLDDIGGALVDPSGLEREVTAGRHDGDDPVGPLTVAARRLVVERSFPGELERAAGRLGVGPGDLTEAVVRLPSYRTYLEGPGEPTGRRGVLGAEDEDEAVWRSVDHGDHRRRKAVDAVLDPEHRSAAMQVQQLTGAVMAKGVEDTAWYRLAGPLAFCEVGGDPGRSRRDGVDRLHTRARRRAASGQAGLVPGTTHDTKRSQDVRCRLYALSELADRFEPGLGRLRTELGIAHDGGEYAFETRVLAQLLLGILPPLAPDSGEEAPGRHAAPSVGDAAWPAGDAIAARLGEALRKGAREAKVRSSWEAPDEAYEDRLRAMADAALADHGAMTRRCFAGTADEVARLGAVYSLSTVVLRHALPGVPDCYQGDEVWNLSLVDPDNRRPVAFDRLAAALGTLPPTGQAEEGRIPALRRAWRDGRVKLYVTARCLAARSRGRHALHPSADHTALEAAGLAASSVVAFARSPGAKTRSAGSPWMAAVVTRGASALGAPAGDLPSGPSYAGTSLALPPGAPSEVVDALTGRPLLAERGRLDLGDVLAELPVALLGPADRD